MRPFTKQEFIAVGVIMFAVLAFMLTNLNVAVRRARDAQRKADLGAIADALEKYKEEFGYFPPSIDGAIGACKSETFDEKVDEVLVKEPFSQSDYISLLGPCKWGLDGLTDLTDDTHEAYMKTIPQDPKSKEKTHYLYISNLNRYQLYTYLEGEIAETGYNEGIVVRDLKCGDFVCSFGKSFAETPLDRSIEEYEEEMAKKMRDTK